jgi:hypothetical protein
MRMAHLGRFAMSDLGVGCYDGSLAAAPASPIAVALDLQEKSWLT